MKKIYYVEDDQPIAQLVADYLRQRDYLVTIIPTVAEARQALSRQKTDLCLIDWNMPDGQGDVLCRSIRSRWKELPVIFLTVRGDVGDIVSGFRSGADDYVVKPFELEVLCSRIQALLRRSSHGSDEVLCCDHISVNQSKMTVFLDEEAIAVSQTEYQLLLVLMTHKGQTITREQLLSEVWGSESESFYSPFGTGTRGNADRYRP